MTYILVALTLTYVATVGYLYWNLHNCKNETEPEPEIDGEPEVLELEDMKISVIILTYDKHHQYLQEAINSVTFEDFLNVEIIVVNNSPDTPIQDNGTIKVINLEQEVETGKARNIGFEHSTGETVLFLDGDDWLMPRILDFLWYAHTKEPDNIIYGSLIRGDNGTVHVPQDQYRGQDREKSVVKKGNRPYCCLIPRHRFEQVGGFDAEMESWEDLDFEIKTYLAGIKDTRIPQVVYYYRWNDFGRRALMDNQSRGYDEKLAKTVKGIMYDRYKSVKLPIFEGEPKEEDMGCSTCSGNIKKEFKVVKEVPVPQQDMLVFVEYIHPEEIFRTTGSYSNQPYKFSKNRRLAIRQVTMSESFDPTKFIHYHDAVALLDVVHRGYNRIKVYTQTIFKEEPVQREEIVVPETVTHETPLMPDLPDDVVVPEPENMELVDVVNELLKQGVIEKRGSWYVYGEVSVLGIDNFIAEIEKLGLESELNDYL